jgi:alkyl hydroperoxide reductase subunit AhpC
MFATVMALSMPVSTDLLELNKMKRHGLKIKQLMLSAYTVMATLLSFNALASTPNVGAEIGSHFPVEDLNVLCKKELLEKDQDVLTLVFFLPNDSNYESMLDLAYLHYFQKMGAFADPSKIKPIRKIYIKGPAADKKAPDDKADKPSAGPRPLFLEMLGPQKITLPSDCQLSLPTSNPLQDKLVKQLGISFPKNDDAGASVFLVDQDHKIQWRDDDYQAQGEHLKPLERKIKSIFTVADPLAAFEKPIKPLSIGDLAPDFTVDANTKLSDFRNKTTLVTFYPAAFSGTLKTSGGCMMCCSAQIMSLASSEGISEFSSSIRFADEQEGKFPVERLAITSSTPKLLEVWQETLRAGQQVRFVNDLDYSAAQAYSSYDHEKGYNRRTVFIVDHQGKIAFIDWDYTLEDAEIVKTALTAVSQGKQP